VKTRRVFVSLFGLLILAVTRLTIAEPIAPGVTHTVYNLPGPVKVHVVAVDRFRSEYSLKIGWPQAKRNFSARAATSAIAKLYENPPRQSVLAATNGSFFETAVPLIQGATASDGEMLEPPNSRYETFLFGPSRLPVIREEIAHLSGTLTFADGSTTRLHQYNRPSLEDRITAYTPAWAPSTGTMSEGIEVILTNVTYPMRGDKEISGVVTAIKTDSASTNNAIPDGGMVINARGESKDLVLTKTAVGDRLRMRFATSAPEFNNADMAITGAGWIIHDTAPCLANWAKYASAYVDSRHPRTVLGWSNTQIFLIVVDGRSANSIGMTFGEMTEFFTTTLGMLDAVNLDGDGSSTMVVNGTVRNSPSDGTERAVANAVLLVRSEGPDRLPFFDPFAQNGRRRGWDDKFRFNGVRAFSPAAPNGDGYAIEVAAPDGGAETVRYGDFADADYSIETSVYCEYRPDVADDGLERYGIFARDSGTGAFGLSTYGGGNCYALTYDSGDGRIRAGVIVNGVLTDFRESDPFYADTTAWRRFRIDCHGSTIDYYVDGEQIASATNTKHTRGYFGIAYQSFFKTNANMHATRADNFAAVRLGPPPGHAPYLGAPFTIPGTIQAEYYDNGGEGIAYHDRTPGNSGGQLRSDDVDIEACTNAGGYYVAAIEAGEWLEYLVNVPVRGDYDIKLRVASPTAGGAFHIEMNGRDVSGPRKFDTTEGSQNWLSVIVPRIALEAANWQALRVASDSGDWNLNDIEIAAARRTVPADFDYDGDVDLRDFDRFKSCYGGENRPPAAPNCEIADLDHDGDVDEDDFAIFEKCFNGANRPPACQ
jgi:hypothetical protein